MTGFSLSLESESISEKEKMTSVVAVSNVAVSCFRFQLTNTHPHLSHFSSS